MAPLPDLWRRYGALGVAGLVWTHTLGRVLDVSLVLEWELPTDARSFAPVTGYEYAKVAVSADSNAAREAAALLRVRLEGREGQDLFVATSDGRVVACTWNDPVGQGRASQRGVAVASSHRRKGLAESLLSFQAAALAGIGADTVDYRTPLANRASRRLFEKLGAQRTRSFVVMRFLGRTGRAFTAPDWLDRALPGPRRPKP